MSRYSLNPNNVAIGLIVILDNESRVVIHSMTPQKMFSTVSREDDTKNKWTVMTNRLRPQTSKKFQEEK